MVSIGLDIGGTKISAGLVVDGKLERHHIVPTPETDQESAVLISIVLAIRDVWSDDAVGIGVGVPGLVDVKNGIVFEKENINNLRAYKSHIKKLMNLL